jgi:hypothetical protein
MNVAAFSKCNPEIKIVYQNKQQKNVIMALDLADPLASGDRECSVL